MVQGNALVDIVVEGNQPEGGFFYTQIYRNGTLVGTVNDMPATTALSLAPGWDMGEAIVLCASTIKYRMRNTDDNDPDEIVQ